jgi:ergothioneine biosynthesis protein EgtB
MTELTKLAEKYRQVRQTSLSLCEPLELEDYVVQPMDNASPPKWHLAHVTWFFETFILKPYHDGYRPYHPAFEVMFNSYYNGVGRQFPRPQRGNLSRPTVAEIIQYRSYVDEHVLALLGQSQSEEVHSRVTLGINHEQQHQELILTDLKYNLGRNPLAPAYRNDLVLPECRQGALTYQEFPGGIHETGYGGAHFCFDNERPRHEVLLRDYAIGRRLVTNAEYLAFIADDGYRRPELWLADAWPEIDGRDLDNRMPLYWRLQDGAWYEYTLAGLAALLPDAPVCHVSGYEADAYARWRGCRLPSEAEWEVMAAALTPAGNFIESGYYHPVSAGTDDLSQVYGDTWEWTNSSYSPYPGFRPLEGQLGEYNGKFMANQLVLRGGSCVTAQDHMRPTYRNFFYPGDRWQFSGIRLVQDLDRARDASSVRIGLPA